MFKKIRLSFESIRFAAQALKSNLMRTTLSLLGVTVGIFSIITVLTLVDSLEKSIQGSLSFLGDNVIRVEKFPWEFEDNYPWWRYVNRPKATYDEYVFLNNNLKKADAVTIFAERYNVTVKQASNSLQGAMVTGIVYTHKDVFEIEVEDGRYFSMGEMSRATNVTIIGAEVAKTLFPNGNAVGKDIKIKNLKFRVVGVMKAQGENIIDTPSADDFCYIPYHSFFKLYSGSGTWGVESILAAKGQFEDKGSVLLEGELRGLMRAKRGLLPHQEDNFGLNRPEVFANMISDTFGVITVAGWLIGSFAMLVGGFGIANIMFVSVRERTNIIGIQKSLGGTRNFILIQFLSEAIFLSFLGGGIGLLLVYLLSFASLGSLELTLTIKNISIGLGVSGIIGVLSGIIPAGMAAKMDPVEAIRSN